MIKLVLHTMSALLLATSPLAGASSTSAVTAGHCCRGGHGGGRTGSGSRSRSRGSGSRSYATRAHTYSYRTNPSRAPHIGTYHSARSAFAPRSRSLTYHSPGERDSRGRLERSSAAKSAFERQTSHPGGWKGHVVDHIVPLACGGADAPSNMQWQTTSEAKAKDGVERRGCGTARRH